METEQGQGSSERRYFSTVRATNWSPPDWKEKLLDAVLWFIPRANPDYEGHYTSIRKWYIEVDQNGQPTREIALDDEGSPLFGAPWQDNFGFWVDSDGSLPPEGTSEIDEATFTDAWSTLIESRSK